MKMNTELITKYDMLPHGAAKSSAPSPAGRTRMCLLHWLYSQAERLNITVCAAHFEHGLRGEESLQRLAALSRIACRGTRHRACRGGHGRRDPHSPQYTAWAPRRPRASCATIFCAATAARLGCAQASPPRITPATTPRPMHTSISRRGTGGAGLSRHTARARRV